MASLVSSPNRNGNVVSPATSNKRVVPPQARSFAPAKSRPGQAKEMREAVRSCMNTANVVRHAPLSSQPMDYESFLLRNKTSLENDPQRDMLLFPRDDIAESSIALEERTTVSSVSQDHLKQARWLLSQQCLKVYSAPHKLVHFNYAKYGKDYAKLTVNEVMDELNELTYEVDIANEETETESIAPSCSDGSDYVVLKKGTLMQAPEHTLTVSFKGYKKRQVELQKCSNDKTYLQIYKEEKSQQTPTLRVTIQTVLKGTRKGKQILEVIPASCKQGAIFLTSDLHGELDEWLTAINSAMLVKSKEETESVCSASGTVVSGADSESIGSATDLVDGGRLTERLARAGAVDKILTQHPVQRRTVFSLYPELEPFTPTIESSLLSPEATCAPKQHRGASLLVECRSLTLKLPVATPNGEVFQQMEPFFIRLYVFDARKGCRVSEELHLDMNDDTHISVIHTDADDSGAEQIVQLRGDVTKQWIASKRKRAVFSIGHPHAEMYLVARIERILQQPGMEAYMRPDPKTTAKLMKSLTGAHQKLKDFRQVFAWTAKRVFDALQGRGSTANKSSLDLYKCDDSKSSDIELGKFLADISKPEKAAKLHVIPGGAKIDFFIEVSGKPEEIENRVTSSYLPLHPFPDPRNGSVIPVFEMEEFPTENEIEIFPHTSFKNLLYIYPETLKYDGQKSFSKARNLTLTVEVRREDTGNGSPMKVLFAKNVELFCDQLSTTVAHHELNPSFSGEEFKMVLPVDLDENHHLLFRLSHISINAAVKETKKPEMSPANVDTTVGYSWLCLCKGDRLVLDKDCFEVVLPVAQDLPDGYLQSKPLGLGKGFCGPEIRWVEAGKPLLKITLRLVSSIFTTDTKLQNFFQSCQRFQKNGVLADANEMDKTKLIRDCLETVAISVKALLSVDTSHLVPFLVPVLNQLFTLLPLAPAEETALSSIRTLVHFVDSCACIGNTFALRQFVALHFRCDSAKLHECICTLIPLLLRPAHSDKATTTVLLKHSWFFLEICVKSMALTMINENGHKATSRSERFSSEFQYRVETMVKQMVATIVTSNKELPSETKAANYALAYFLRSCFSLLDRGFVFKLVHCYCEKLDSAEYKSDLQKLREYKLDLLQILCEYEHWLPLNLPVLCDEKGVLKKPQTQNGFADILSHHNHARLVGAAAEKKSSLLKLIYDQLLGNANDSSNAKNNEPIIKVATVSEVTDEMVLSVGYCERHYLVGVLLQEVQEILFCHPEMRDQRKRALRIFRNLLAKHAMDPRYSSRISQARISALYFPFIRIVLENLSEIELACKKNAGSDLPNTPNLSDKSKRLTFTGDPSQIGMPPRLFVDSHRGSSLLNIPNGYESSHQRSGSTCSGGTTNSTPVTNTTSLTVKLDSEEVKDMLICCLYIITSMPSDLMSFWWKQSNNQRILEFLKLLNLCVETYKYQGKVLTLKKTSNRLRSSRRTITLPTFPSQNGQGSVSNTNLTVASPFSVMQVAALAQEVNLSLIDIINSFTKSCKDPLLYEGSGDWITIGHDCLRLYLRLLKQDCSEDTRLWSLSALANFVKTFPNQLKGDSLGLTLESLLLQLSSRILSIQRAAAALILLLLRSSAAAANGGGDKSATSATKRGNYLGRVGLQVGVSLARLLGDDQIAPDNNYLHRGLSILDRLIDEKAYASAKHRHDIRKFAEAAEKLLCQLRSVLSATIALKGAENEPYRLAELHLHLADTYKQCAPLRQAWLETLARGHTNVGAYTEAALCHLHVAYSMALFLNRTGELDVDLTVIEGIVGKTNQDVLDEDADYTVDKYLSRVEMALTLLIRAERYEQLGPMYRLVIPTYEDNRDYQALSDAYSKLHDSYKKAATVRGTNKRRLATYFRVKVFCQMHDDNQREWLYKENGFTTLADFSERLRNHFIQILGHARVKLISEGDTVQTSDETSASLLVTHVEPVPPEDIHEPEDIDYHTNVDCFAFENRLLEDGGSPQDLTKQCIKRVVLKVNQTFPCLLRRLPVIDRMETQLDPLTVAVEQLNKKTGQLEGTLNANTIDVVGLQLLLQGIVLPQVNSGPISFAQSFMCQEQFDRYGEENVHKKLKLAFKKLCAACSEAVDVNAQFVSADQTEYQKTLVDSLQSMVAALENIFNEEMHVGERESSPAMSSVDSDSTTITPAVNNRRSVHVFDKISGL